MLCSGHNNYYVNINFCGRDLLSAQIEITFIFSYYDKMQSCRNYHNPDWQVFLLFFMNSIYIQYG